MANGWGVVAAAALAAASPALRAADWPQWGGNDPGRNMVSPETGLPDTFEPGTKDSKTGRLQAGTTRDVRWGLRIGSYIYGNPVVAGGRVFAGSDASDLDDDRFPSARAGLVTCLDEADGKRLWRLAIPKRRKEDLPPKSHLSQQHLGVCSSPAVSGDRVYVVTQTGVVLGLDVKGQADGNDGPFRDEGQFMAGAGEKPVELRPTDADIVWAFDLVKELDVCPHDVASCSPLVHGPYLYLCTSNGVDEPHLQCIRPDAPSFIVLDRATGRLVAADGEKLGRRLFHCLWSPPSLGVVGGRPRVFFGGGDGVCYAFEAPAGADGPARTLEKVWWYDGIPPAWKGDGSRARYYEGDKRKKGSPNTGDGTYVGPSEIIATPVFHEGRVYVAIGQDPAHGRGRGMLHCIDASGTGDITERGRVWSYDGIERSMSGVALYDGRLYAADLSGRVHCLDPATGKVLWTHDLKAETWATPLAADGKVYVGTVKGLYVLAAGAEPKVLAHVGLGSASYGTPVAVNGTLFVASQKYLWAVQKGATLRP